ncbi:MAG: hypothetical protein ACRD0K_09790 [Egibacteraceae bacterium]
MKRAVPEGPRGLHLPQPGGTPANERYLGSAAEVQFIAEYLHTLRMSPLAPQCPIDSRSLSSVFRSAGVHELVDSQLFLYLITAAQSRLRSCAPTFKLLPLERFYVSTPGSNDDDSGGFHGRHARGFDYIYNFGFAALANPRNISHVEIRTLEVARSYLHDSIHASSYRTFRRRYETPDRPIYRAQYGVNFRRPCGTSYSPRHYVQELPVRLNLGVLMDGLTARAIARSLRPLVADIAAIKLSPEEKTLIADVICDLPSIDPSSSAYRFHRSVTDHVRRFLTFWHSAGFEDTLFKAMISGHMGKLCRHVDRMTCTPGAWKTLFMSAHWLLSRPRARVTGHKEDVPRCHFAFHVSTGHRAGQPPIFIATPCR